MEQAWKKYRADPTIETLLELRSQTDPYPQHEDTGAFCRSLRKMLGACSTRTELKVERGEGMTS